MPLVVGIGILFSARFAWLFSHAEKWDTPAPLPSLIFCELPMLLCVLAMSMGENSKRSQRAAGLVFGMALSFCLLWLPLGFDARLTAWEDRGGYLAALDKFFWPCLFFAICALVVAWFHGRGQRRMFVTYGLMGLASFALVCFLISAASVRGSGEIKQQARFQQAGTRPDSHVMAIAACLIRHHFLHPDEGFPSSLSDIQPDWNCSWKLSDPWALNKYWIYYSPMDRSYRGYQDFRVASVFTDNNAWLVSAIDKRGEVLQLQGTGLSAAERRRRELPLRTVNGEGILHTLFLVRDAVTTYMNAHDPKNAPQSLDAVMEPEKLKSSCDDAGNPQERVIGRGYLCFDVKYFPPAETPASTFAISLQCVSYGDGCLRSYFLDYDGTIHATVEPRAATNQDPGLLPCEVSQERNGACDDPVWNGSGQLSRWTFMRARLLDAWHSATW